MHAQAEEIRLKILTTAKISNTVVPVTFGSRQVTGTTVDSTAIVYSVLHLAIVYSVL